MKHLKYAHSFEVFLDLPEPLQALKKLAFNLRWSWHHETQSLFQEADKALWEEVEHNPLELISRLTVEKQQRLMEDAVFMSRLAYCESSLDKYMSADTWFNQKYPEEKDRTTVAYFCAEFGLTESLPIYSGGLGVLAGDHLKAASDLGIPLVGVGLLYSRGYFRQSLSSEGWQQEVYPQYDFYRMPLQLLRGPDQQPLRVDIQFPDRLVTCNVWLAQVGRVPLYLLDSNVLENEEVDKGITDTLYGGDQDMRLRQEVILGIGGLKALAAMGIEPTVCHLNEGHAAFVSIERMRQLMEKEKCDFRTARKVIVSGNVFTTHTPVPAGFDLFPTSLVEKYLGKTAESLGLKFDEFTRLGKIDPENEGEPFNMAVMAMENANYVNGVSKLHAHVSREMFQGRWPDYPVDEVPVDAVTNGIHTMTWIGRRTGELLDRHLGLAWRDNASDPQVWQRVNDIPDEELWELREDQRGDLVRYVRRQLQMQLTKRHSGAGAVLASAVLDPRVLTIGFARRFATYKRAYLLFSDKERLKEILFSPDRPVQFVFAGKSHPRDDGGKNIIKDIWNFIREHDASSRIVFLEDYDMEIARAMVQGVDVWLNNPRRPMEASGTSGMKVVPNGGLNCSILDGWWAEAYRPGVGWAIGAQVQVPDEAYQDWLDANSLYGLIQHEIAPKFYQRGENNYPAAWVQMMKASMIELGPFFSTARMVREYTSRYYVPASSSYQKMRSDGLKYAKAALQWRQRVRAAWPSVHVCEVKDNAGTQNSIGAPYRIEATVDLDGLSPDDVRAQAIVGQVSTNRDLIDTTVHDMDLVHSEGTRHVFAGEFKCTVTGHRGYVVRIVPRHEDIRIPSELSLVAWEGAR